MKCSNGINIFLFSVILGNLNGMQSLRMLTAGDSTTQLTFMEGDQAPPTSLFQRQCINNTDQII